MRLLGYDGATIVAVCMCDYHIALAIKPSGNYRISRAPIA